jgi:hypothetical protein
MTTIPDSVVEAALLAESRHYDPCCSSSENYKKRYPEQYAINMAAMRAALEAAAPLLAAQWIRCSDRMPKIGERVLVCDDEQVNVARHIPGGGWAMDCSPFIPDYWQLLPQPPKESP